MIRWLKENPSFVKGVVGAWAFFATATSLVLGVMTYQDSSSLDRLEAREKLDSFMAEARVNYSARCLKNSEKLRPIWQERFEALLDVAKVDANQAPYNYLCKYIAPPSAVSNFGMEYRSSKSAPTYSSWKSFLENEDKNAAVWVGEVPLIVNISSLDFIPFKKDYEKMVEELKLCESKEQAKSENTFVKVKCVYDIDEQNEVVMSYATTIIK